MSQTWEHVGPGRYALEFHGHVLQAIRNPERGESENRPYLAVVDRVPLAPAEWSLARAKTKAMRHVLNKLGKPKPKGNAFQPDIILHKSAETADLNGKSATVADLPPEPEPVPEPEPDVFAEIFDLPAIEPAAQASPQASEGVEPGVLVITGHVTNPDLLAGLNEIRSLLELMREHAEVKCHINMPPVLIL